MGVTNKLGRRQRGGPVTRKERKENKGNSRRKDKVVCPTSAKVKQRKKKQEIRGIQGIKGHAINIEGGGGLK